MEEKKEFDAKKMRKYLYDGDKRNWGKRDTMNPCTYCKRRLHAEEPYCNFYDCCQGRKNMNNLLLWENDGTATEEEVNYVFYHILKFTNVTYRCNKCEKREECRANEDPLCSGVDSACSYCKGYVKNEDFFCANEIDEDGRGEDGCRVINSCKYYDEGSWGRVLCKHWQDNGENPEYSEMRRVFLEKGSLAVIWHKVQTRLLKEKLVKAFEENSAEIKERKEYLAEYREKNGMQD